MEAALVDDGRDVVTLHISDRELGTSSLLDFDESIKDDEYWKSRPGLTFERDVDVAAMSLSDLIANNEIDEVAFVKIDVQGLDVEVLLSAGEHLGKIKAGMLEVPVLSHHRLYTAEVQTLTSAVGLLEQHGFEVVEVKSNDPGLYEVNVYFVAKGVSLRAVEDQLQLRGTPIYDDKWLWALPCTNDVELAEAQGLPQQLERTREELHATYGKAQKAREELEALRAEFLDNRASMQVLERSLKEAQDALADERKSVVDIRARLDRADNDRESEVAELTRTFHGTTSWRVTTPLRAVTSVIKR